MLNSNKNYCLVSKSEFLKFRILDLVLAVNAKDGIFAEKDMMGKYLEVSDTAEPTKRKIVISFRERKSEEFEALNIDDNLVHFSLLYWGYAYENPIDFGDAEVKSLAKLLNSKLQRTDKEVAFYYVGLCYSKFTENGSVLDYEDINKILNSKEYKGKHTTTELYTGLIEFIQNPTEINLSNLLLLFNEDDYQRLINCISSLVIDTPEWLKNKFERELEDSVFLKRLLKLSMIAIKSDNRDYFILNTLTEIIY